MNTYKLGGTITLSTTFKVGGVLTDPATVTLIVEAPDGSQQTYTYAGATITKDSTGTYHKDYGPAAQVGVYSYSWTGTGAAAGVEEGQFVVEDILAAHPSDLTTLGRVKLWLGQDTNEVQLQQLITSASGAVMAYCQREFAPVSTATTRTFPLLAGGLVRFGGWDLQAVTGAGVQIDTDTASTPTTIPDTQYQLGPVSKPNGVYTYIRFYTFAVGPILRQAYGLPRQVAVTGTWGWPSVPTDVEQACTIAVAKWYKRDQVAWSSELPEPQLGPGDGLSLPYDARVLLAPYRRPL